MVAQEIAYLAPAGLLGTNAVVIHPYGVAKLLSQLWLGWCDIHIAPMHFFYTALLFAQKEKVKLIQVVCSGRNITDCFY